MDSKAEVRFGERLRELLEIPAWSVRSVGSIRRQEVLLIAGSIDQDASDLAADRDAWKEQANNWWGKAIRRREPGDLRQQLEELVEELRYAVQGPGVSGEWLEQKDVLDVEPFLARLAAIFGVEERDRDAARVDELLESYAPGYLAWLKEDLRARLLAALLEELPTESSMGDRIPPIVRQVFEEVK